MITTLQQNWWTGTVIKGHGLSIIKGFGHEDFRPNEPFLVQHQIQF
jgi:hypothetical protein